MQKLLPLKMQSILVNFMKVLITGSSGQLGWELQRTVPDGYKVSAFGHTKLDITDASAVDHAMSDLNPDLVINAAAYTAVDKAEEETGKAYAVNAQGAAIIATAAANSNARLIHLSTDFVFDGLQTTPYQPDDKPHPICVYGSSKLEGEKQVADIFPGALIIRTGWLYSAHGHNFAKTMINLINNREELTVVADQIGTPTWAKELAKAIWNVAEKKDMKGIYHWTDSGVASWYDFAVAIQEEALETGVIKKTIPIYPIRTADYPTPAKRPPYSVLDKTATWNTLGYKANHWRINLRKMLKELGELNNA
jgi:dTDP-4-dehydrorhamnose reductase